MTDNKICKTVVSKFVYTNQRGSNVRTCDPSDFAVTHLKLRAIPLRRPLKRCPYSPQLCGSLLPTKKVGHSFKAPGHEDEARAAGSSADL